MHNQPHRQRQPFLEQFQGRKNAVGREGLMHLLEQQQQSHQRRHEVTSHRNPKQLTPLVPSHEIKETPPLTQPNSQKELGKGSGTKLYKLGRQSQLHGSMPEGRYRVDQQLNEFKSQELASRLKLPAINKSSSVSHAGKKHHHTDIVNAEATGTTGISGKQRSKALSNRGQSHENVVVNSLNKKMELDSYAMRHLQFLDKFEKQLLHNDMVSKRTAKTRMHQS